MTGNCLCLLPMCNCLFDGYYYPMLLASSMAPPPPHSHPTIAICYFGISVIIIRSLSLF